MQSPDVELVEPVLVKEEKMEANASPVEEAEEDIHLIGDDGKKRTGNLHRFVWNSYSDSRPVLCSSLTLEELSHLTKMSQCLVFLRICISDL